LAYNVEDWNSFLIAISAADGVLLGLMITAITVRISLIEARRDLAARAYGLLAVLFDVLVAALCSLAPIGRIITGVLLAAFGGDIARNFLLSSVPPAKSAAEALGSLAFYTINPRGYSPGTDPNSDRRDKSNHTSWWRSLLGGIRPDSDAGLCGAFSMGTPVRASPHG
jgi:hypothetical protein